MASRAEHRQTHAARMDAIYRWQRLIYDVTRKYYLFGRDSLITALAPQPGDCVLELGCGTGRNLALVARRWPGARLFGLDISNEMLRSAEAKLGGRATLVQGDACAVAPTALFSRACFDRVILSYALSMIPDWEKAMAQAMTLLAPEGELHIVDFGTCDGLATPLRAGLWRWLARFDVTPRLDLHACAEAMARQRGLHVECQRGLFGYFQRLVIRR